MWSDDWNDFFNVDEVEVVKNIMDNANAMAGAVLSLLGCRCGRKIGY